AMHNFPMSVALPPILGGAVIVSPNISYQQVWIAQKFRRTWNPVTKKLDTSITKGFFADHSLAFGISFNTALFGTLQFKNKKGLQALRHVIRPSFSINYKPDLSKTHFYKTHIDTTAYEVEFSEYEGALYSGFGKGRTGGIGLQIDNNLEYKWRKKSDTSQEKIQPKKLIDGYGLSTGYNFLRDSLKLDLINLYLRSTLFEKISITASGTLNPYQSDKYGRNINKYMWEGGGKFKLGRITNGNISISSNFSSKPKDAKKAETRKKLVEQRLNDPNLVNDQRNLLNYMQQNPGDFVDFNIPWQMNVGYSLSFYERPKDDYSGFTKDFTSNINFNGSFNLTSKWNFSANGFFDIDTKKLQSFQMSINRDMHCWQLSISVTPVGLYRFFSFSISPKSPLLQDLKINRSRSFQNF
ncbi:MAG TPA: putative LPS assembly protein LptD, partial [Chitinophagaceae bacterium]|nr:putative LPS assembly protein LptD [Chitinophagaceae bacterium]